MALTATRLSVALAVTVASCSRPEAPAPRTQTESTSPPVLPHGQRLPTENPVAGAPGDGREPVETRLAPLQGSGQLIPLEVPGFQPAVLSVPEGATGPRPVAVALHGNFDRPEWQCSVWRGLIGGRGFILCPRGVARRDVPKSADRWEYGSGKSVEAEIDAGLSALSERFGAHVDPGPLLFIGFSLGAIHGSALVQKHPARFPRAVLVEGGLARWNRAAAKKFADGGGLRLLLACGQAGCVQQAKRLTALLDQGGLASRSTGSSQAGHTYDGSVADAVGREFSWLVEGDERWEALEPEP